MLLNRSMTPERRSRRLAIVGALAATSTATLIQFLTLPVKQSQWLIVSASLHALALPLLAATFVNILNTPVGKSFTKVEMAALIAAYTLSAGGFWLATGWLGWPAFLSFGLGVTLAAIAAYPRE